jgi:hypothetical protein
MCSEHWPPKASCRGNSWPRETSAFARLACHLIQLRPEQERSASAEWSRPGPLRASAVPRLSAASFRPRRSSSLGPTTTRRLRSVNRNIHNHFRRRQTANQVCRAGRKPSLIDGRETNGYPLESDTVSSVNSLGRSWRTIRMLGLTISADNHKKMKVLGRLPATRCHRAAIPNSARGARSEQQESSLFSVDCGFQSLCETLRATMYVRQLVKDEVETYRSTASGYLQVRKLTENRWTYARKERR